MHLFIEKGMRGGISTVGEKRHAKANNPYMVGYDKTKETSYIMYLDENNEYGWAMMHYLPTGDFRWLKKMPTEKEIKSWGEKRRTGALESANTSDKASDRCGVEDRFHELVVRHCVVYI